MCLAIPGKIVEFHDNAGVRMGKVDFGGITREACMEYVADARLGDYVMVHVGFAISKVDVRRRLPALTSSSKRWIS